MTRKNEITSTTIALLCLAVVTASPRAGFAMDKGTTLLSTNQFLMEGDYLLSENGNYKFILQNDGNLVLYRESSGRPMWASHTDGKAVSQAIMQVDGNFVIYGFPNAIWATNTNGKPNSRLIVQNDGNVVIYVDNAGPVWATNTNE